MPVSVHGFPAPFHGLNPTRIFFPHPEVSFFPKNPPLLLCLYASAPGVPAIFHRKTPNAHVPRIFLPYYGLSDQNNSSSPDQSINPRLKCLRFASASNPKRRKTLAFPICIMRLDYYGVTTLEYFALTYFRIYISL